MFANRVLVLPILIPLFILAVCTVSQNPVSAKFQADGGSKSDLVVFNQAGNQDDSTNEPGSENPVRTRQRQESLLDPGPADQSVRLVSGLIQIQDAGGLHTREKKSAEKDSTLPSSSQRKDPSQDGGSSDLDQIYLRFLEVSMDKNDKNRNGRLDPSEIAAANWSSPPWQQSDANGDGTLSRNELKERYRKMFAKILGLENDRRSTPSGGRGLTRVDARETPDSSNGENFVGGGLSGDMLSRPARRVKQPEARSGAANANSTRQGSTRPSGSDTGPARGNTHARTRESTRVNKPVSGNVEKTAKAAQVEVDLFLVRVPRQQDREASATIGRIKRLASQGSDAFARLEQSLTEGSVDRILLNAFNGSQANVNAGSQVPVATSVQHGRGGARSENFEMYEIGLQAEVRPVVESNYISLQLELNKRDVVVDEAENHTGRKSKPVTWEHSSTIRVETGRPAVVATCVDDQCWILVVYASLAGSSR